MGKFVSVINEQGYPLHIDLLCTFEVKNDEYALFEYEGEDKRRISRISYDVWNGNVLRSGKVSNAVESAAKLLIDKNVSRPDLYVFEGEHYKLQERGEGKTEIRRKADGLRRFSGLGAFTPILLKLLLTFLVTACVTAAYSEFCMLFPSLLFTKLPFADIRDFLWLFGFAVSGLLFFVTRRQTVFNLTLNGLVPMCMITFATGFVKLPWLKVAVLISGGFVLLFYILPVLLSSLYATLKRKSLGNLIDGACHSLSVVIKYVIIIALVTATIGFSGGMSESVAPVNPPSPEKMIENYQSVLTSLDSGIWSTLSLEEKTDVLTKISDYECEYVLGIKPVAVRIEEIGGKTLNGKYVYDTREVFINTHAATEPDAVNAVETLLHEIRHSWQVEVSAMYDEMKPFLKEDHRVLSIIRDGLNFEKDMCDVYNEATDFAYYLSSATEQDSRTWAYSELIIRYGSYLGLSQEGMRDILLVQ